MSEEAESEVPAPTSVPHPRWQLLVLLVCGVVCALACWSGCSVEKNYDTLSFFFDGVPDPKAIKAARAAQDGPVDLKASPTYSMHVPYKQDQCSECHGSRFRLTVNDSGVCLKCHENVPTSQARVHGPVAASACLWCHAPHDSAEANLMRYPGRKVCVQCHDPTKLSTEAAPEHADAGRACLDCHMGHGGNRSYFLKEQPVPPRETK